jgi:hypothetical protein
LNHTAPDTATPTPAPSAPRGIARYVAGSLTRTTKKRGRKMESVRLVLTKEIRRKNLMDNKRIIEINGVKLEVDLTTARVVDNFRIGDKVKVLKKADTYSDSKVFPGVIIGFEEFQTLPTIVIAYLDISYSKAEIKFLYFNSESKTEVVKATADYVQFNKEDVISMMDKEIVAKERELIDLNHKKEYFLNNFNRHFEKEAGE